MCTWEIHYTAETPKTGIYAYLCKNLHENYNRWSVKSKLPNFITSQLHRFWLVFEILSLAHYHLTLCYITLLSKYNSYISQGSVAKSLRHGGIINYHFIAKLLLSVLVKDVLNIWSIFDAAVTKTLLDHPAYEKNVSK